MIILRLLLLLALATLAVWAWRRLRGSPRDHEPEAFEPTAVCARCGARIPRRQAVTRGDEYYCRDHAP